MPRPGRGTKNIKSRGLAPAVTRPGPGHAEARPSPGGGRTLVWLHRESKGSKKGSETQDDRQGRGAESQITQTDSKSRENTGHKSPKMTKKFSMVSRKYQAVNKPDNLEILQFSEEQVSKIHRSFHAKKGISENHGAAGGTRVRANTSMLVLVHGPGSGSAALAAESLLNTGKCKCDAGKVYVRCLYRR